MGISIFSNFFRLKVYIIDVRDQLQKKVARIRIKADFLRVGLFDLDRVPTPSV